MSGFVVFAGKEAREILKTWRIWVLPGILIFFAVTGPMLARFTPEIVGALAGSELGDLTLPPPTFLDAYGQWIKNLGQITLFALIIIYGGIVSAETSSGTAILVLTKPMSRGAFVVVKALVHAAFLAIVLVIGTLITWGLTAVIFGDSPGGPLWRSALVWLVLGVLFVAVMTFLSVLIPSPAGAAGAGVGAYILLAIAGIWTPLSEHSPAGLLGQATALAGDTVASWSWWPVVTGLTLAAVLVGSAALLFRRKDL